MTNFIGLAISYKLSLRNRFIELELVIYIFLLNRIETVVKSIGAIKILQVNSYILSNQFKN